MIAEAAVALILSICPSNAHKEERLACFEQLVNCSIGPNGVLLYKTKNEMEEACLKSSANYSDPNLFKKD